MARSSVLGATVQTSSLRYRKNGELDTSFGTGGIVTTRLGLTLSQANAVVIQPDGKIVVGGFSMEVGRDRDFLVARYNADGSLDSTFGDGGVALTDLGGRRGGVKAMP
jgi:uncharacterized delta-60 repeat protein